MVDTTFNSSIIDILVYDQKVRIAFLTRSFILLRILSSSSSFTPRHSLLGLSGRHFHCHSATLPDSLPHQTSAFSHILFPASYSHPQGPLLCVNSKQINLLFTSLHFPTPRPRYQAYITAHNTTRLPPALPSELPVYFLYQTFAPTIYLFICFAIAGFNPVVFYWVLSQHTHRWRRLFPHTAQAVPLICPP